MSEGFSKTQKSSCPNLTPKLKIIRKKTKQN